MNTTETEGMDHRAEASQCIDSALGMASTENEWSPELVTQIAQAYATLALVQEVRALREEIARPKSRLPIGAGGPKRADTGGQS